MCRQGQSEIHLDGCKSTLRKELRMESSLNTVVGKEASRNEM